LRADISAGFHQAILPALDWYLVNFFIEREARALSTSE